MSKVICDICGTSYPDTDTQCPICGCVRPAETVITEEPAEENSGYTYVKGGRFSKSNVRKRNQAASSESRREPDRSEKKKFSISNNRLGLIIVLICLTLLVVSMFIYIGITIAGNRQNNTQNTGSVSAQIPCTGLSVSYLDATLTKQGEVLKLEVACTPDNTTDKLLFSESSAGKVVTVDENGNVTCVGNGKAVITITCGEQKKECRITCAIEEPILPEETDPPINVQFFTHNLEFTFEKERFVLYATGDIPAEDLTWISDDTSVATVDNNGTVFAVSNGETNVHARYNGQTIASCHVRCNFKDFEIDDSQEGGETEPAEEYYFGSIFGELLPEGNDVYGTSLKIGDEVQFGLIHKTDRTKNIYFQWERVNPDDSDQSVVTSEDKLFIIRKDVAPANSSYCYFKATYEGKEYFLKVRYLA